MSGPHPDAEAAFGQQEPRKRATSLGYWLAGLAALGAVVGGIAWLVAGFGSLDDSIDELHRVEVPGQAIVELEPGDQSVYWEGDRSSIPPVEIAVRRVDGPAVTVGPHGGRVTYDVGGRSGIAIAGFEIDDGGRYLVVAGSDSTGVVAVGPGVGGHIVRAVVGGLGIFFGGLLLCGVLIMVTARRRR